jgi:2-polyprenyl-3-methyl-5-hydroxy-6-metoxy-1,4-benzoquinol methylase
MLDEVNIRQSDPLPPELVDWNDRMYRKHPTPYDKGLAGTIQRARVRAILRLASIGPGDAVLELGCESGKLLAEVPPARRVVGADISGEALRDAERLFQSRGRSAEWFQVDAQKPLPFEPGEFDVILCAEMLEHVERPRDVLEQIHALAGPGTRVVVSVPIEAPKLVIKRILMRTALLRPLFPGIEAGQSEWHLHAFSGRMLRDLSRGLFDVGRRATVWGCHHVALLRKRPG